MGRVKKKFECGCHDSLIRVCRDVSSVLDRQTRIHGITVVTCCYLGAKMCVNLVSMLLFSQCFKIHDPQVAAYEYDFSSRHCWVDRASVLYCLSPFKSWIIQAHGTVLNWSVNNKNTDIWYSHCSILALPLQIPPSTSFMIIFFFYVWACASGHIKVMDCRDNYCIESRNIHINMHKIYDKC